jgi:uncharacterized membrane protein (DUF485 family)
MEKIAVEEEHIAGIHLDVDKRETLEDSGDAFLVGAGAYIAATNNLPVLSPILYWITLQTYRYIPVLANYNFTHAPYVVAAVVVGGIFFCLTVPFTHVLANVFSRVGISNFGKTNREAQETSC